MASRVTFQGNTITFLEQVSEVRSQLGKAQVEVSTGSKVNTPSDEPSKAGIISQLKGTLQRIERHEQRIAYATNFLDQQENIVTQADSVMIRALEIATQGANEVLGTEEREILAEEVFALRDTLVNLANSKIQGRYIYAGGDDGSPPFELETVNTYTEPADLTLPEGQRYVFNVANVSGSADPLDDWDSADDLRSVRITDDQTVRITSRGDDVFRDSIAALERLGRSLKGYDTDSFDPVTGVADGTGIAYVFPGEYSLQTGDIQGAIDDINSARQGDLMTERTNLGSRLSKVELAREILASVKIDVDTSRSLNQDADIFEAAAKLSQLQVSLEATLASGARLNQLSLLDFL